ANDTPNRTALKPYPASSRASRGVTVNPSPCTTSGREPGFSSPLSTLLTPWASTVRPYRSTSRVPSVCRGPVGAVKAPGEEAASGDDAGSVGAAAAGPASAVRAMTVTAATARTPTDSAPAAREPTVAA